MIDSVSESESELEVTDLELEADHSDVIDLTQEVIDLESPSGVADEPTVIVDTR